MRGARLIAPALAGWLVSGCSATIHRHRLPDVEGVILSSDPEGVNVRSGGRLHRIPRHEISDIDHPGNAWLVVGGVTFAFSAMMIAMSTLSPDPRDARFGYALGASYSAMGVIFAVGGGIPWASSRGAAASFEHRELRPDDFAAPEEAEPYRATYR